MQKLPLTLKLCTACALFMASPAFAESLTDDIHGRLQLTGQMDATDNDSLSASLGEQYRKDAYADLRLTWEPRWNNWDATFHYQATADGGNDVAYRRKSGASFTSAPPSTLFDLSGTMLDENNALVTHKIDRMAIGYSTPGFVIRVGRQALTWGAGKMFQTMDLVGPFAPNTVDTEYKPGVDMAYTQWLFDDGSDLQFVAAPRARRHGDEMRWDASTVALHYRRAFGDIGTTWLLSHDYDNWVAGLGLSGPLYGASWNIEVTPTFDVAGNTKFSGLANIDYAMLLFGERNTTLFAEYYHNGFGVGGDTQVYDQLPAYLTERLARGQVFNISRNYLSSGMTVEWTPLLKFSPSLIANLDDTSFYASTEANYSLGDNTTLLVGAQTPIGPAGTEYGGISLSGGTAPYVAPSSMIYVQLRQYF